MSIEKDKRPSPEIRIINREEVDNGRASKIVFYGVDSNGKGATFETGSFFDGGGNGDNKHDICVSTAGGCTRSCNFCAVPKASLGYERLLSSEEIIRQVKDTIAHRNPNSKIANVVGLMGNGEPPDNFANVIPALRHLIDNRYSIDRITISTIGESLRGIEQIAIAFQQSPVPVRLQFSLHVADEEKRRKIIPGKRSLNEILRVIDQYEHLTGLPVKFNVVLMEAADGSFTNASLADAEKLRDLLLSPSFFNGETVHRRLKLSTFNPIPGILFQSPDETTIKRFVQVIADAGIPIKTFRGSGIEINGGKGGFACGQLRATTKPINLYSQVS